MPQQDSHNLLLRSFSDIELLAGKIQFEQNIAFNCQIRERGFSLFWPIVDLSLS